MKLKSLLSFFLIGLFSFSLPLFSEAGYPATPDEIYIEGEWDDRGARSLESSHPVAFLDESRVYLFFPKTLTNIEVKILDFNGNIVFKDTVSAEGNSCYYIPCVLSEGEYILALTHKCGVLDGDFCI